MSATYEVLEPGGHARLVGNVLDRISSASSNPASSAGSSASLLADTTQESWTAKVTEGDGAALVESVKGNTLRWGQMLQELATASWSSTGNKATFEDNTAVMTPASQYASISTGGLSFKSGHSYLLVLDYKFSSAMPMDAYVTGGFYFSGLFSNPVTGTWDRRGKIRSFTNDVSDARLIIQDNRTSGWDEWSIRNVQLFDLTAMFGAGNEPATVAEFEALYPKPYYPYDPGSLLPVRMEGIETVGFNQWDEQWVNGNINEDGTPSTYDGGPVRSKNYIPVFPSTAYYCRQFAASNQTVYSVYCYDANKDYIGVVSYSADGTFTPLAGTHYIMFRMYSAYGTTYQNDICINISDPSRNGTYEPYWSSTLEIPATNLRSAGTVRDELREGRRITRVGVVDLGTLTWGYSSTATPSPYFYAQVPNKRDNLSAYMENHLSCAKYEINETIIAPNNLQSGEMSEGYGGTSDLAFVVDSNYTTAADFKAAMSGVMLNYELATPTTTPIDPPLCMSYRTESGGTERVTTPTSTMSAPPVFATRYPLDPADLAASIAPREYTIATGNHAIGDLLMLGFTLCKVTTAIARGEAITIGTNVTRTSVAAEIAALS